MTDEEKRIKQQQIEDMMNENSENLEEIFNEESEEEKEEKAQDVNVGSALNTEIILSMMGSIVKGAYAGLPEDVAILSYNKWYGINKTIFIALNMDERLKNIKLVAVPDPIAYIIAGGAVVASTLMFVNSAKKQQLEESEKKEKNENKWKKEEKEGEEF